MAAEIAAFVPSTPKRLRARLPGGAPDDEHQIAWRSPEQQADGDLIGSRAWAWQDDSDENVMIGQQGVGLVKDEADSDENVRIGQQGMGLV